MNLFGLGLVTLCGVLYVVFRTKCGDIHGEYMLCALFDDYLVLARYTNTVDRFIAKAIIALRQMRVVGANDEQGKHPKTI